MTFLVFFYERVQWVRVGCGGVGWGVAIVPGKPFAKGLPQTSGSVGWRVAILPFWVFQWVGEWRFCHLGGFARFRSRLGSGDFAAWQFGSNSLQGD